MKATVYEKPGDVELKEVPKPEIKTADDAIIKVVRACVCGSDLWFYRGIH